MYASSAGTIDISKWYHFGVTFNNTTKDWQVRVWDDDASTNLVNDSGTASNNMYLGTAPFAIGAQYNSGAMIRPFDGLIDEVVIFDDILTTG